VPALKVIPGDNEIVFPPLVLIFEFLTVTQEPSSFFSKSHKSNDYLIEKAVGKIKKIKNNEQYDLFISGHIHKPYLSQDKRICITGDFNISRAYAVINERGVFLEYI